MSSSNKEQYNLPYNHWKPHFALSGNNTAAAAAAAAATNYQNIMKMAGSAIPGGVIHQHHSPQLSEEHLIPAHTAHSPHSMSRIIASPGSSNSLYSPGSSASSSTAPTIPRAHQHNVPMSIIQTPPSPFVDQSHQLDVYSQIGMQRIGQMFKSNLMANNNNNNCNNKNAKTNRPAYENSVKMEQSMNNIKQLVESAIGIEAKQQIMHILEKISLLQPPERLLLYLRMPSGTSETDPLRQPQNPLGTRSEINFTINWVRSHLEMDPNVSIPKQDVYDEYTAYCAREDVKPLSTADFGKVMKQIFPSIRPRRLGTRGNSRYCYAAMRKTTKLECPQLPSLGAAAALDSSDDSTILNSDGTSNSGLGSSASWNVIKTWAESLLNIDFKTPHELADHISTNYMSGSCGTISSSSRALLQKKLLQRKVKGRKKKSMSISEEIMGDGKKRRKKRFKKMSQSTTGETGDNDSPASISTTNETNVPDEIMQIKQEQNASTSSSSSTVTTRPDETSTSQAMPINLTNENHGKVKSEVESIDYGHSPAESIETTDYSNAVCKIELDESSTDIDPAVYCKKLRRAKGLSISLPSPKMPPQSSPEEKTTSLSPASMLMRPPMTEPLPTDLSVSSSDTAHFCVPSSDHSDIINPNLLNVTSKRHGSMGTASGRIKKLRFHKHASVAGLNETKVDDISTDIIIPRERVVSICNMDKDALDDYLNEGGDSQEQEAELLQYFQTTAGHDRMHHHTHTDTTAPSHPSAAAAATATAPTTSASTIVSATATNSAYPLLENYQLHHQGSTETDNSMVVDNAQLSNLPATTELPRKQDQINELRQYLQQNLHQPPIKMAEVTSSSQLESTPFHAPAMHSAADSLTALSLPYQHASSHDHQTETTSQQQKLLPGGGSAMPPGMSTSMRGAAGANAHSLAAQHSPNSRSKNFSFVPISPGPQSPRVVSQQVAHLQSNVHHHGMHGRSTFLSPRRSPAVRKLVNKDMLKSLQDPSISTFDAAFKNEISASAPASPSMTPHHFQFNTGSMSNYNATSSTSAAISSTNQSQPPHQHQAACTIGMCPVLERSQSVPLHCQSPAFNAPGVSSTAYNSVCNSVAQTPVPSEYGDFTEDNFFDMLAESSDDHQLQVDTSNEMSNLISANCMRNISRSVPSTPLPIHGYHGGQSINNFGVGTSASAVQHSSGLLMTGAGGSGPKEQHIDNSRSVPTTPILLSNSNNNSTPFRYSPDHHRDFLINGNTIDAANKTNHFYSIQSSSSAHDAVTTATAPAAVAAVVAAGSGQPSHIVTAPEQHASVSSTQSSAQVLLTATSSQPIEDLPNYSDVNDPIIEGSHLINNL